MVFKPTPYTLNIMNQSNYIIRAMTRDEMYIPLELANLEGWNPGLYDAEPFYQADSQGFLLGILDNEPIATISAVRYGATFGFVGLYIVKKNYRGLGYGLQIWNAALKHLEGRNIGLDGVIAQQNNYQKSGFKMAYRDIRYEGISKSLAQNSEVIDLLEVPFEIVNSYDKVFFPDHRTQFLKAWIQQPESKVLGIVRQNKIVGYGVIRTCQSGYKIGPLFADSLEIAESIFISLQSEVKEGKPFYLDVPEVNQDAQILIQKYNLKSVFETARMYKGSAPDLPINRIFGVTSLELG